MARTSGREIWIDVEKKRSKEWLYNKYGKEKVDMVIAVIDDDREAMIQIITRQKRAPDEWEWRWRASTRDHFPVFRMLMFPHKSEARFDKNVVTAAVMHDPANLRWVVDPETCDIEVVKEALRRQGRCILYAKLWKSAVPESEWKGLYREFVLCAAQSKNASSLHFFGSTQDGCSIDVSFEDFRDDREVVMEAVKSNGLSALRWASKELQKDREIIFEAVKSRHWHDIFAKEAEFRPPGSPPQDTRHLAGDDELQIAHFIERCHYHKWQHSLFRIVPWYSDEERTGPPKVARYACEDGNKYGELCDEVITAIQTDDYLREWVTYGKKQHRSRRLRDAVRKTYCNPKICAKVDLWLLKNGEPDMLDAKRRRTHHL